MKNQLEKKYGKDALKKFKIDKLESIRINRLYLEDDLGFLNERILSLLRNTTNIMHFVIELEYYNSFIEPKNDKIGFILNKFDTAISHIKSKESHNEKIATTKVTKVIVEKIKNLNIRKQMLTIVNANPLIIPGSGMIIYAETGRTKFASQHC
jgi:hypothetical protein